MKCKYCGYENKIPDTGVIREYRKGEINAVDAALKYLGCYRTDELSPAKGIIISSLFWLIIILLIQLFL